MTDPSGSIPFGKSLYRLSPVGVELRGAAKGEVRHFLDLIEFGWSVEEVIARTKAGRAAAVTALAGLVEEDAVIEVAPGEIRPFAADLVKQNRYRPAIGAYERLLEFADDPSEREHIEREIKDCEEAMAVIAATRKLEDTKVVTQRSDRHAAPPKPGKFKVAALVALLFAAVAAAVTVHVVTKKDEEERRKAREAEQAFFVQVEAEAKRLRDSGEHLGAVAAYKNYRAKYPDGAHAQRALDEIEALTGAYEAIVTAAIDAAVEFDRQGKMFDAVAAFEKVIKDHPESAQFPRARELLGAAKKKRDEFLKSIDK